jgi:16S rRNA (uracil1498-N3)-methyltransferase
MEYFYTPPDHITTQQLTIDGDEFSHLAHVMRKKPADTIRVVDGNGTAYDATITEITKRSALCTIHSRHTRVHEAEIDMTLAVALLKNGSNFDFLVEKTTELGVNAIIPLRTERTIPQHAKIDRWQKLALAAMKQSGRCVLPRVAALTSFKDFLAATTTASLRLIPHEKVELPTIAQKIQHGKHFSAVVCIGPEGGFSDEEIDAAIRAGFTPVSLGARRLRTETAAIVAVAAVLV